MQTSLSYDGTPRFVYLYALIASRYTGKERDSESGLDYFGARYYGSSMGRFMSPDPITVTSARQVDPQQLNLYSYVRNNPLTLTDPSGMIINTDDLNDKDKALWAKIAALANKQNADGSYVNSTLHSAYSALDSDSRTFRIEDDKSLGASTAGQFEITKFNGPNDFSEAKVELNFGAIKDMTSTTPGNYDSSFQKYDGLFGKNGFLMRLTETFGHEASHGVSLAFVPSVRKMMLLRSGWAKDHHFQPPIRTFVPGLMGRRTSEYMYVSL